MVTDSEQVQTAEQVRALELEREAEILVVQQVDLLAQLEQQLRAAHGMMRHIQKLRGTKRRRPGPRPSILERRGSLEALGREVANLERELDTHRQSCADILRTIDHMLSALQPAEQCAIVRSRRSTPR
jgi:hypothetical protein